MKSINYACFGFLVFIIITASCNDKLEEGTNLKLDKFCSVAPAGWECTITTSNFDAQKIPYNTETPVAIISYRNPELEFTRYPDNKANPSLIIDIYEIGRKQELLEFIRSQQLFSWCIPIYYGETEDYFIITSPCFINGGSFTDEANSSINDLHEALKDIITIIDYNLNEGK